MRRFVADHEYPVPAARAATWREAEAKQNDCSDAEDHGSEIVPVADGEPDAEKTDNSRHEDEQLSFQWGRGPAGNHLR